MAVFQFTNTIRMVNRGRVCVYLQKSLKIYFGPHGFHKPSRIQRKCYRTTYELLNCIFDSCFYKAFLYSEKMGADSLSKNKVKSSQK